MWLRKSNYRCMSTFVCAFLLSIQTIMAAPKVSKIEFTSGGVEQGAKMVVKGSGFGAKSMAHPIMYDNQMPGASSPIGVSMVNGSPNNYYADKQDGFLIKRYFEDPEVIWRSASNGAFGSSIPMLKIDNGRRYAGVSHYYHFGGHSGFVGWPSGYYDNIKKQPPEGSKSLYLSWWYRPTHHPVYSWRWTPLEINGTFHGGDDANPKGDEVVFVDDNNNVKYHGYIIAVEDPHIYFVAYGARSSAHLKGLTMKTVSGSASTKLEVLTDEPHGQPGTYASPGSNKFVRVWDEETGKKGFRFSWTNLGIVALNKNNKSIYSYTPPPLKENDWNHMELEINLRLGMIRAWVNGVSGGQIHHDHDSVNIRQLEQHSPTIALIGFNGKNQKYQSTDFGEVYMDKTLQRVVIGDQLHFKDVRCSEIQYPLGWSNNEITLVGHLGTLDKGKPMYLFVFDASGNVNETGFPLNFQGPAAPLKSPVDLRVNE